MLMEKRRVAIAEKVTKGKGAKAIIGGGGRETGRRKEGRKEDIDRRSTVTIDSAIDSDGGGGVRVSHRPLFTAFFLQGVPAPPAHCTGNSCACVSVCVTTCLLGQSVQGGYRALPLSLVAHRSLEAKGYFG